MPVVLQEGLLTSTDPLKLSNPEKAGAASIHHELDTHLFPELSKLQVQHALDRGDGKFKQYWT